MEFFNSLDLVSVLFGLGLAYGLNLVASVDNFLVEKALKMREERREAKKSSP